MEKEIGNENILTNCIYLQDDFIEIEGIKIYGILTKKIKKKKTCRRGRKSCEEKKRGKVVFFRFCCFFHILFFFIFCCLTSLFSFLLFLLFIFLPGTPWVIPYHDWVNFSFLVNYFSVFLFLSVPKNIKRFLNFSPTFIFFSLFAFLFLFPNFLFSSFFFFCTYVQIGVQFR